GQRQNLQLRGQSLRNARKEAANTCDDVDCRSVTGLEDGHQGTAPTILAHDVGLRRKSVAHIRHVTKIDRGIANDLYREVVELWHRPHAGVESNVVLEGAHLRGS